ncbi:general odorant-binding protein 57c [Anabrus simplex]|uniref:general odorant-binding protein 57c n=1 Tax=Anabrus simplex TaxID=316456 RepID=UPI0035A3622D
MKTSTALVFLALVAACLAEMNHEEAAEKCKTEVGAADDEELKNDESKRKCFMKCVLESAEVMDADGTPNSENAEKLVSETISDESKQQEVMDAFKQCADKTNESQETDPCEKGAVMFGCLMENKEIQEMMQN